MVKKSKVSRWRAAVLIAVHVVIAVHIGFWVAKHPVITPVEPSEAMQFSKYGIINAGLIFFALATLSTAILGRWFCGWGCHLVAVQDLSRWILARFRIRPKPLRSRILATVPLVAFIYMFLFPLAYRAWEHAAGNPHAVSIFAIAGTSLTTTDFWATFPGWIVGGLTLGFCGFAAIYLLGAKGFCTNACPYGAIFGVADQVAPLRIRVTDACEGCGHCTAICSSNVRVHEEVRQFGMVVDPGCMKCLDCVSVCPNDALFFGLGPLPFMAGPRKPAPRRRAFDVVMSHIRSALPLTIFALAALTLFVGFDIAYTYQPIDLALIGLFTLLTGAVLAVFGGARTSRALPWHEEWLLGIFLLAAVFAFRHLYGLVAFLFALGIASCAAYLATRFMLLFIREQLTLRGTRLKVHGEWRPPAYGFAAFMVLLLGFWGFCGVAQARELHIQRLLSKAASLQQLPSKSPADAGRLLQIYSDLIDSDRATIDTYLRAGTLAASQLQLERAQGWYEKGLRSFPGDAHLLTNLALVYAAREDVPKSIPILRRAIDADPNLIQPRLSLAEALCETEQWTAGLQAYDDVLARNPNQIDALFSSGLALAQTGNPRAGLARLERARALRPNLPEIAVAIERVRALISTPPPATSKPPEVTPP